MLRGSSPMLPELRIGVGRGELGETLIDSGARELGSIAAGLRIAEICAGGLAEVRLAPSMSTPRWPWTITVQSSQPVIALFSPVNMPAGVFVQEGGSSFFALGSGPARALARREPLFEVLAYAELRRERHPGDRKQRAAAARRRHPSRTRLPRRAGEPYDYLHSGLRAWLAAPKSSRARSKSRFVDP